jgi:hypothetical protein
MVNRPVNSSDRANQNQANNPTAFVNARHRHYLARDCGAYQFRSP